MSKVIQGDTGETYIARRRSEGATYEEALAEWRQHTDVDQGREANSKLTENPAMDAPPVPADSGTDTQAGGDNSGADTSTGT